MAAGTIVLCSSAAFYEHVNELADELSKRGFTAVVPITARRMREAGDYDVSHYKTWYEDEGDYHKKAELMRKHFDEVAAGDAILVVNDEKHGIPGYIGPNVLMEMGLAFHLHKSIYVLNPATTDMPLYEEVMGMGSVILDGDLTKIDTKIDL
jgi:hypothetical protein